MKENTYIYREIMDKLNESSMLMTNYLMSTLRSDGHAMNPAEVEKCYNGLLEEYSKVCKYPPLNNIAFLNTIVGIDV